jgi:Icc-related predicted phosphoesterase
MRIYAVADVHGKPDRLENIRNTISEFRPDVLVVAGDITNIKNSVAVIKQLNTMPVPVLAIRGNTDLPRVNGLLNQYPNTVCLHLKEYTINGIRFVGVSGTIPLPFRSKLGFAENRILKKLGHLVTEESVVVAHPPPWGILDKAFQWFHAGSKNLYRFIKYHQPRLLLCGHIHEWPGKAFIGKTLVVNCNLARKNAGAIIELVDTETPIVNMI